MTDLVLSLKLYKTFDGFMGKLNLPETATFAQANDPCNTFVILDRSGSMGQNVGRIFNRILPNVFEKLNYPPDRIIKTIMFDNGIQCLQGTIQQMRNTYVNSGCTTWMSPAIPYLKQFLTGMQGNRARILTFSDGELHDQNQTLDSASQLTNEIRGKYCINSQAIRYFTSSQQPDTRGLASILQLNSISETKLLDIYYDTDFDVTANQIAELFKNDGLDKSIRLVTENQVLLPTPWDTPLKSIYLNKGDNTIWFNKMPTGLKIEGTDIQINIELKEDVNANEFEDLIRPKLDFFINKLKVLKVVNTQDAKNEITNMMNYFTQLQSWMVTTEKDTAQLLESGGLKGRVEYFKAIVERKKKTVFQLLAQIANDDKVSQLNSAQQADYLRTVTLTKNAKDLARRAVDHGIDFNSVLHKEVHDMHTHLNELDDIDDSNHSVSFYSQGTTLDGIRALCSLVDEKLLTDLNAPEILQMVNIVGVAANAFVGDYPDPMVWRVNSIYPGCYISMSDIMMAHLHSGGRKLFPPGFDHNTNTEITTTIPIFENIGIFNFLKKYAPMLLEYSTSVGMRRLITGVPLTYCYTICAGIAKLAEILDQNKSTVNIQTFMTLLENYASFAGKHFDHVFPCIKDQDNTTTYFINNNGLTNMIYVLYKLYKQKNAKYTKQILRSIYAFESYQMMRRVIKKHGPEDRMAYIEKLLFQLLGIDYDKYGSNTKPLFENDPKPVYHDQYHINTETLQSCTKDTFGFKFFDYMILLPLFFEAIFSDKPIQNMQAIPQLNETMVRDGLGIDYDLETFKFYALMQALFFPSKKTRVDTDNRMMKIPELGTKEGMEKVIKTWVVKQYHDNYQHHTTIKAKREKEFVNKMYVDNLVLCKTIDEFCQLLKEGITFKHIKAQLVNETSLGYTELKNNLTNQSLDVPERLKKIVVLFTSKDFDGNVIWNNGNPIRIKVKDYECLFNKYGGTDELQILKDVYSKHPQHIYRDKPNRHTHCNDKPSYWAFGWNTLEDMIDEVSPVEWEEYKQIHTNCCGIKYGSFYSLKYKNSV